MHHGPYKHRNLEPRNLASKWRPRTFDEVVGQDVVVRVLRNSLYHSKFFPVYLMSGQRGCGKTSVARIFSAAVNCQKLDSFLKSPKSAPVPCNDCASCKAMLDGRHPDFIEMDAASHTGVDNIRQVIDASTYVPVMGRKKIYLLDEAHMLSKAAFNALLKVLEEPSRSVLFILATTEFGRVIDTVRSRCFQLHFKPVQSQVLHDHLSKICKKERIACSKSGIEKIAKESGGAVRDALNILENLRFGGGRIDKRRVEEILGQVSDDLIFGLIQGAARGDMGAVIRFLDRAQDENKNFDYLWRRMVEAICECIRIFSGASERNFSGEADWLNTISADLTLGRASSLLTKLHANELVYAHSNTKRFLLESLILDWILAQSDVAVETKEIKKTSELVGKDCNGGVGASAKLPLNSMLPMQNRPVDGGLLDQREETLVKAPVAEAGLSKSAISEDHGSGLREQSEQSKQKVEAVGLETVSSLERSKPSQNGAATELPENRGVVAPDQAAGSGKVSLGVAEEVGDPRWMGFVKAVDEEMGDPLLHSIFRQARCSVLDDSAVKMVFPEGTDFFKDILEAGRAAWQKLGCRFFGESVSFEISFTGTHSVMVEPPLASESQKTQNVDRRRKVPNNREFSAWRVSGAGQAQPVRVRAEPIVDVSDATRWPRANRILEHFPGVVVEVREGNNEKYS